MNKSTTRNVVQVGRVRWVSWSGESVSMECNERKNVRRQKATDTLQGAASYVHDVEKEPLSSVHNA